jgi:hypothetical protein
VPLDAVQRGPPLAYALAYSTAAFLRTLTLPDRIERWSLTTRAKMIGHAQGGGPARPVDRMLEMIDDFRRQRTVR